MEERHIVSHPSQPVHLARSGHPFAASIPLPKNATLVNGAKTIEVVSWSVPILSPLDSEDSIVGRIKQVVEGSSSSNNYPAFINLQRVLVSIRQKLLTEISEGRVGDYRLVGPQTGGDCYILYDGKLFRPVSGVEGQLKQDRSSFRSSRRSSNEDVLGLGGSRATFETITGTDFKIKISNIDPKYPRYSRILMLQNRENLPKSSELFDPNAIYLVQDENGENVIAIRRLGSGLIEKKLTKDQVSRAGLPNFESYKGSSRNDPIEKDEKPELFKKITSLCDCTSLENPVSEHRVLEDGIRGRLEQDNADISIVMGNLRQGTSGVFYAHGGVLKGQERIYYLNSVNRGFKEEVSEKKESVPNASSALPRTGINDNQMLFFVGNEDARINNQYTIDSFREKLGKRLEGISNRADILVRLAENSQGNKKIAIVLPSDAYHFFRLFTDEKCGFLEDGHTIFLDVLNVESFLKLTNIKDKNLLKLAGNIISLRQRNEITEDKFIHYGALVRTLRDESIPLNPVACDSERSTHSSAAHRTNNNGSSIIDAFLEYTEALLSIKSRKEGHGASSSSSSGQSGMGHSEEDSIKVAKIQLATTLRQGIQKWPLSEKVFIAMMVVVGGIFTDALMTALCVVGKNLFYLPESPKNILDFLHSCLEVLKGKEVKDFICRAGAVVGALGGGTIGFFRAESKQTQRIEKCIEAFDNPQISVPASSKH